MIDVWERFKAWVHRREVTFFLVMVAVVAALTVLGL